MNQIPVLLSLQKNLCINIYLEFRFYFLPFLQQQLLLARPLPQPMILQMQIAVRAEPIQHLYLQYPD